LWKFIFVCNEVRSQAKVRDFDICSQYSGLHLFLRGTGHVKTMPRNQGKLKGSGSDCLQQPKLSGFQNQQMKSARAGLLRYMRHFRMQFDPQRSHDLEDGRETRIAFAG
jgi:predicted deacylase